MIRWINETFVLHRLCKVIQWLYCNAMILCGNVSFFLENKSNLSTETLCNSRINWTKRVITFSKNLSSTCTCWLIFDWNSNRRPRGSYRIRNWRRKSYEAFIFQRTLLDKLYSLFLSSLREKERERERERERESNFLPVATSDYLVLFLKIHEGNGTLPRTKRPACCDKLERLNVALLFPIPVLILV